MKIVIDEVTSRITKSRPHAKVMTFGANNDTRRRAELMERWNDGEVHKLRQSELFDSVMKDGAQYGLAALKHTKAYRENRIKSMRVYPGNLFVDLQETVFEEPTRLHHRRFVSKTQLATMFPKSKSEIADSDHVSDQAKYESVYGSTLGAEDVVELVESWHLPSYLNKDGTSPDGIRALWIEQKVLQVSVYNRRQFPFSFFNWKRDPHNTFYGIGLGEDLLGVHIDANVTLNRVNNAIEAIALPIIVTKKGVKVSKAQITNRAGAIWEYEGNTPPQVVMSNVVAGDLLRYVQEHEARAYRIAGLSSAAQLSGGGGSLQTGRAVENFVASESIPFNEQLRKYENFIQHVAENNFAVGAEIYEQDKSFTVVLPGDQNTIEEAKWSDMEMDPAEASYVIRVTPTSALSETPAARLAEIERMVNIGMVTDPAVMKDLYNIPDLESHSDYFTAAKRLVDKMADDAINDGIFTAPTPNMDKGYARIRWTEAEQKAYAYTDVPEENIATLRRMVRRVEELIQIEQAGQQTQAAGMITPTQPVQQPDTGVAPTAIQQAAPG
jgi:hypothetical protein